MQDLWSPLHNAAFNGHVAIVKLLLQTGGKTIVHTKTQSGNTALDLARNHGRQEVVDFIEKLLKMGPPSSSFCPPPWHDTTKYDDPYTDRLGDRVAAKSVRPTRTNAILETSKAAGSLSPNV